jgi:glycosyltransferase involved in cell wall biosynthesis
MRLTAVVPFYNGHATLGNLLNSLPRWLPVIVVDDHSDEALSVNGRANVRVIRPPKKGYFSGAVNAGIEACDTDVLVLNQDAWLEGRQWQELVMGWQADGVGTGGDGVMNHPAWPKGYVQGTFMYMSRKAINAAGPLNTRDYPLWGATAEWQLRACRKGFEARPISPVPGLKHEHRRRRYGSAIRSILKKEPQNREWFVRTPPMISVIVPCYNYGRYLTDAINSLVGGPTGLGEMPGQTFQSFEIVIVNDGSQDETHEVATGLADDWQAIRYINLPQNRGLPTALNTGISRAYGDYISILSADDMRESWHYETFYRALEGSKTGFVYGDIMGFRDGQRTKVFKMHDYDFGELLYRNCAGAGILYHKSAWEQVGGYSTAMKYGREDWAFNIALGLNGHCGKKVDQPGPSNLYRRERQNRSFRTRKFSVKTFLAQIKALYPAIYAGEIPVGCCGGRSKSGGRGRTTSKVYSIPGVDGMTRLEYVGSKIGSMSWRGADGRRYKFGNNDADRVKFVDNRDVQMFLDMRDKRKPLFRRYKPASPAAKLSPQQKAIANPVLPAKVPASDELIATAEGMPQDADLVKAEKEAPPVPATSKAKILAGQLGVQLAAILGTGRGGKVTVKDVRDAASV